jgi:hypothetical protein
MDRTDDPPEFIECPEQSVPSASVVEAGQKPGTRERSSLYGGPYLDVVGEVIADHVPVHGAFDYASDWLSITCAAIHATLERTLVQSSLIRPRSDRSQCHGMAATAPLKGREVAIRNPLMQRSEPRIPTAGGPYRRSQYRTPSPSKNACAPAPCSRARVDIKPASVQLLAATVTERGEKGDGQPVRASKICP